MVISKYSKLEVSIDNVACFSDYFFDKSLEIIQPDVHAAWKLNPPVMASMFKTSPPKYKLGYRLEAKVPT